MSAPTASPLQPRALLPLPVGRIRPRGWLARQLRIQADALTGHLDEFWPDIRDSGWIGGSAEGWERGPYWLDGLIPLAFQLDDAVLKAKVRRWLDHILTHQHPDGWLGPVQSQRYEAHDPWPVFVMLKGFVQYVEATADPRGVPAMARFLRRLDAQLDAVPLFVWGRSRWADLVLSVHWLYERTGEAWLLDLAAKVADQGYNWRDHFARFQWRRKVHRGDCQQSTHVVNNAMAVKQPGVWWRQSGEEADRTAPQQILATLDRYHGMVTGVFTGDEHYAGRSPSQGTELCAVVEEMFSLEVLSAILGDPSFADRLERIAYNALPGTFSADMWAHQYDQQVNQVRCAEVADPVWTNNGGRANLYGLEPNYGCCTANLHQGWPKLTAHLWMATAEGGLAAVAYAPCQVDAGDGRRVLVETEYPFRSTVTVCVSGEGRFPVLLRIPAWAEGASVRVEGEDAQPVLPGTFHRIEHQWRGETLVELSLPMAVRAWRGWRDSVALRRGPLVFSLDPGEEWRQVAGQAPHADYEVHPTGPWNYGLALDPEDPAGAVEVVERPVGDCPFSLKGAPVRLRVRGRRVPGWGMERANAAQPPPPSPVASAEPLEELTLVPYGCTCLRVTEFPVVGA
ncbi:MAG: beta-L-arabinofuranosidase domain-containing protein [Candidatus Latescibacterota bacterium]